MGYSMTTFLGNFVLFFRNIFLQNISKKKAQSSAKTSSLLLINGVAQWRCFPRTLSFFFEIFFSKIWWIIRIAIALSRNQSISIPTKCTQTPTFFWCTDSSRIMFVLLQFCATQCKFPFPQLRLVLTNNNELLCAMQAQPMETRV